MLVAVLQRGSRVQLAHGANFPLSVGRRSAIPGWSEVQAGSAVLPNPMTSYLTRCRVSSSIAVIDSAVTAVTTRAPGKRTTSPPT